MVQRTLVRDNYDVTAKVTNQYISNDRNIINRYRNTLISAIKDEVLLAKIIVIIPDDDIFKLFDEEWNEVSKAIGRVINEIMASQTKLIQMQKDFLPKRSKKVNFPQILWIKVPVHDNFKDNHMRHIFNERLNTVSQFYEGITVLKLKKIWDPTDSNLFLYESNRFTSEGINAYWAAVDCTIRFMDTIMIQKVNRKSG